MWCSTPNEDTISNALSGKASDVTSDCSALPGIEKTRNAWTLRRPNYLRGAQQAGRIREGWARRFLENWWVWMARMP
jgi:hypothetical protein